MPITILRHCQSKYNAATAEERVAAGADLRDADLSAEGERQLGRLVAGAAKLFPKISDVFTSPLHRAVRTAIPIAAALGARLHIEPVLREIRHDIGDVGMPGADLAKVFPGLGLEKLPEQWWRTTCTTCSDMKECDECAERRVGEVRSLFSRENGTALFVCHSDLILAVIGVDLGNGEHVTYTP